MHVAKTLTFSHQKYVSKIILMSYDRIHAPVLLNLLNSLRKRDKMLGKPRIFISFPQLV